MSHALGTYVLKAFKKIYGKDHKRLKCLNQDNLWSYTFTKIYLKFPPRKKIFISLKKSSAKFRLKISATHDFSFWRRTFFFSILYKYLDDKKCIFPKFNTLEITASPLSSLKAFENLPKKITRNLPNMNESSSDVFAHKGSYIKMKLSSWSDLCEGEQKLALKKA
jgi:hypothetical protein